MYPIVRVVDCRDNGGRTADRYSVMAEIEWNEGEWETFAYYLSDDCNMPNGVCMSADPWSYALDPEDEEKYLGKSLSFYDLPATVQKTMMDLFHHIMDPNHEGSDYCVEVGE